jgi:hypothetical protein
MDDLINPRITDDDPALRPPLGFDPVEISRRL